VDPPYARYAEYEEEIAEPLLSVLAPSALVVVETGKGQPVRLPLGERSVKVYGDTQVTFSEVEA
jgi:16S rRNA G966 N2-methylase RsmD